MDAQMSSITCIQSANMNCTKMLKADRKFKKCDQDAKSRLFISKFFSI